MEEVLDSNIKAKKTKWSDLIPSALVLLLFIWKISKHLIDDYYFETESAVAFVVVGVATGLYFVNRNIYIYTVLLVFIAGLIGIVSFTPSQFMVTIVFVTLNPISLILIIVHLSVFFKTLELKSEQTKKITVDREVESFKTKFKDKTIAELEEIIATKGFREEAKQAAHELITLKKSS